MTSEAQRWTFETLKAADLGRAALMTTPSVSGRAGELGIPLLDNDQWPETDIDTLVVVGGGTLIDRCKVWRARHAPGARLVAIPSLWGSGAEASPFAVIDNGEAKQVYTGPGYLPDAYLYWDALAESLPEDLIRNACGDTWAHALEGFLSPLADQETRQRLEKTIALLLELPIGNDPRWFTVSGRACAYQARSSVGLVHGIAHTLEGPLKAKHPTAGWGHARLCATFLWPVMAFNRASSDKWRTLLDAFALPEAAILEKIHALHDPDAFEQALPLLESHWPSVLRDPCTRTNVTMVRPASLAFFSERRFQ